jgi:hypothetical protein
MPSEWKQQCDGFATYRWHESGAIEVYGGGYWTYPLEGKLASGIKDFWDKYGAIFEKYAAKYDIPVAWVVGIVKVESMGNEWACGPCKPGICVYAPDNCGGGVAKDGKHYVCCAYGLMQITDANAKRFGFDNGAQLMGEPDANIGVGVAIYNECLGWHKGDPLVAVRQYNGCSVCKKGWMLKCTETCPFGIGGQNNYVDQFVKTVNTFLSLDPARPKPPGFEPMEIEDESSSPLVKFAGIGAAAALAWFLGRRIF